MNISAEDNKLLQELSVQHIDLGELEIKIDNILKELEVINSTLNEFSSENDSILSLQAKEVEKTIKNFKKLNLTIPEELEKLKLNLVNKEHSANQIQNLKEKFMKGEVYFNFKKQKKSEINDTLTVKKYNYHPGEFTKKKIKAVKLFSHEYELHHWKDLLIQTCKVMYNLHKADIEKLFTIRGKKRDNFSKDPHNMTAPQLIEEIGIYCETNISADLSVKLSKSVITLFGHSTNDMEIFYED